MNVLKGCVVSAICLFSLTAFAQMETSNLTTEVSPQPKSPQFHAEAELGILKVWKHNIQFGKNGTVFDYVKDGGQSNLYPFTRLQAEATFAETHSLVFLYQPFELDTRVLLDKDILVNDARFPAGTPLDLRYSFPFTRLSYLYDFDNQPNRSLAFGASLQLRNATTEFTSANGEIRREQRNVGPVPALKVRYRQPVGGAGWIGFEADGFYASGKILNLSDNDIKGAILDASLRGGFEVREGFDVFANLRYLGGGSEGTERNPDGPGDGFTKNWLHTSSVTLGARVCIR